MGLLRDLVRRCQISWHRPRHWRLRPGTIDARIFRHVVVENEYRLPPRFQPTDRVLDVGGHVGSFSLAVLNRGAAQVTVCEPDPTNLDLLRMNLAPFGQRAVIHPVAVWGSDAPAEPLQLSNSLDPRNTGAHRLSTNPGRPVPMLPFDDLVEGLTCEQPLRLAKLDCEGAEWAILTASRCLDRIDALVGEYHLGDFAPEWASLALLETTLAQAGFNVEIRPDERSPYPLGLFFATR